MLIFSIVITGVILAFIIGFIAYKMNINFIAPPGIALGGMLLSLGMIVYKGKSTKIY